MWCIELRAPLAASGRPTPARHFLKPSRIVDAIVRVVSLKFTLSHLIGVV